MLLLKEAEVSVVCLVIVAFIAIRYFSRVNRKKEGAAGGVFMLIIAFSIMHLAADGIIRIVLGDPTVISSSDMDRITPDLLFSLCGWNDRSTSVVRHRDPCERGCEKKDSRMGTF